jgi:hypothetical protein
VGLLSAKRRKTATGRPSHAETERRRNAARSAEDRDIAAAYPGDPQDSQRREACRQDLERYLRTYFPRAFPSPFCRDHQRMIGRLQEAETEGGLYARALFRGGGKTAIFSRSMLHATMYGLRRFGVVIAATARDAGRIMRQQKDELWSNELLAADFPEICYPCARTLNDGRLARRQIWAGQPTGIVWAPDQVVFAAVPPSKVGGAILVTRAITGAIKGLNQRTADGTILRPDFVLLDDVQTRRSAKSLTATEDRVQTIDGDVLGLAGHDVPITAVMAVTPIYDGDLACIYLSRDQKPEWRGETAPMVYQFPDALDTLWEQYRTIADDERKNDGDKQAATSFYLAHRAEMDAGAVLAWPEGPTSGRASVLQYAMDLYYRSRQAFWAEFQCKPLATTVAPGLMLPADEIARKTSGLPAGVVPPGAEYLTAFIDAGKAYLYYVIGAWSKDFTGSVIEYGAFPQQRRRYYSKDDANPTIASYFAGVPGTPGRRPALAGANEATMLAAALDTFLPELTGRTWTNAEGDEFRLKRVLCDTGDLGDVVCAAIGRLKQPKEKLPIVMPSFGVGIGATKKPFSAYKAKEGDVVGWHWRAPEPKDRKSLREVQIDTNHFKSFLHKQFLVDRLLPGSLTLYGDRRTDHQLLSDHLTAELPKEVENKTDDRKVVEWKQIPGRENEGLDGLVGCAVGASMLGAELTGAQEPTRRTGRKRRPIGELMKG